MNSSNQSGNLQDNNDSQENDTADDAAVGKAFKLSAAIISCCIVLILGLIYFFNQKPPIAEVIVTPLELPTVRDQDSIVIPEMRFTDITSLAGIDFQHENGATGQKLLPESMGSGCAFFDCDNDGDQDILFVNSSKWESEKDADSMNQTMKLFVNDGDGQFEDQTNQRGLNIELYGMGVACGDYDNDGFTDIFISALGVNRLFHNDQGSFKEVSIAANVTGDKNAWSTSCGWFDFDNDGLLDLFVCNYVGWTREFDLAHNFQLTGSDRSYGRPQVFTGAFCYLYHNQGDGTFLDVSEKAGIQIRNPATNAPAGKSLGLSFDDYDDDGKLDIFVSNDTVQNFLFLNKGDGEFEETGVIAGVAYDTEGNARGAMGLDSARFRNNEEIGIAIGNFANEMTALYVSSNNDLQFNDEAISTGLGPRTRLELAFGLFFFDCDLDGRLDLFTANGHLEQEINKVQSSQFYEQPPQLFWNCGPDSTTEFIQVPSSKTGTDFSKRIVGRGAAYADIDADGDLDILISTTGKKPRLLRNDQNANNHWIKFKLVGSQANRDAIGATITLKTEKQTQYRRVMPTRSYLSQVELPVTFGLGQEDHVSSVTIQWPGGGSYQMDNLKPDQLYTIQQQKTVTRK